MFMRRHFIWGHKMSENNSIYISSLDMNRITALLDKMPNIAAELVELEAELDRATVLEPEEMPSNVVTMNSTVEFKFAGEERTMTKTLVYPSELKAAMTFRFLLLLVAH